MHQDDILPWLNAREHTSATSCQESGPLHKPARKDEEHGGQPAPFALVDQYEPFAQVARHALFGQSDCSMGAGREASSHTKAALRGSHVGVRAPWGRTHVPACRGCAHRGHARRSRARRGPRAEGGRVPRLACQPARRAESPGHKKAPLQRAAPSPQTTGANQIRPES